MPSKRVVEYSGLTFSGSNPAGKRVLVFPVDHPEVTNANWALTSTVEQYDETTGIFETENTVYVPSPNSQP